MTVQEFPDAESVLMYALVPKSPDVRFVTVMPAGELNHIVARIHRISGANRDVTVDRPIVDIDVYGPKSQAGNVSAAARSIQSDILSLMGIQLANGVVQQTNTIAGPRSMPEINPDIVRYGATYEMQVRA